MTANVPLVSIGLPVRNGERFLEESLRSLLNQDFADFELIISDNASVDATPEICERYAKTDGRIRYFRNSANIGAARNYNSVFRLSRGKYFKWAACDDLLAPTFLSRCVEVLERRDDVILAYTKTQLIDEHGDLLATGNDILDLGCPDVVKRFYSTLAPMKLWHNPVFGVIRREALSRTRLIGSFLAADRCLIAELSLLGPFFEIPEVLFFRRKHSGNIGTSREHLSFYDPRCAGKIVAPEWKVLQENLATVARSSLDASTKVRLVAAILRRGIENARVLAAQFGVAVRDVIKERLLPPRHRAVPSVDGKRSSVPALQSNARIRLHQRES